MLEDTETKLAVHVAKWEHTLPKPTDEQLA